MKQRFLFVSLMVLVLASCTSKHPSTSQSNGEGEYETIGGADDGVQRMHEYNFTDTVAVDGRRFVYTIHREASDSLPLVTDDDGTRYADNVYTLTVSSGGHEFFHRNFTKGAFASRLSSDFRERGVLDGMMHDSSLPGLSFAVSISMPQSDMVEPLLLHVDAQGGMAIERDERSDADLGEEEDDGV